MGIKRIDSLTKEKILKYFNNINLSGNRLLKLLEDLLRIAKLESGSVEYNIKSNDLLKLIKESILDLEVFSIEKKVEINFDSNGRDKVIFAFDYERLKQVFLNIISNAIKFSPYKGKIFINIIENDDYITISVKDEGPGIDKKDINIIFNSFIQGRRTKNNSIKGAGLGLAISQKIVEKHNGEIWALNNKEENGAIFMIRLPMTNKIIE
jgi:signal transduction histidine kinase